MKIIIEKPSSVQLEEFAVKSWTIWEHGVGQFPWHYDLKETCYLLEGKVRVTTSSETVEFGTGDMVTFPSGLDCEWNIVESVRKHYKFG